MKQYQYTLLNCMYILAGIVLLALGVFEVVDSFWSGMGSALCVVGIIRIVRNYRLNKDEKYKEKVEIELSDERNHYLRNKAWAWAGYLYVLISAVAVIVFKVIGQDMLSIYSSFTTCLVLMLFWFSYLYLKKKY